jgi:hypothetical protein
MPKVIDLPEVQQTLAHMNKVKEEIVNGSQAVGEHGHIYDVARHNVSFLLDNLIKVLLRKVDQKGGNDE